ncbi:MAG TPA: hypothetical protein VFX78_02180 [Candidatus Eisenbacteria bacterium]|nr:hypothetical protein [Candidatus Eisenbacteria bacterium]
MLRVTALGVLLPGVGAIAGEAERSVQMLVDGVRSDASRAGWDVMLEAPHTVSRGPVTCEYVWDESYRLTYGYVVFVPTEAAVDVMYVMLHTIPPGGPAWSADGVSIRTATMSFDDYDVFLRSVRLVASAQLQRRPAARPDEPPASTTPRVGSVCIRLGDIWGGRGDLTPEAWDNGLIGSVIDEKARAFLCDRLLAITTDALSLDATDRSSDTLLRRLRAELPSVDGWRRDLRAAFLGWMGTPQDVGALLAVKPVSPAAERAVVQIETMAAARKGKAGVERMMLIAKGDDAGLRAWARLVLRSRFTSAYKDGIATDYRSGGTYRSRRAALEEYEWVDPQDTRLYREALADASAGIRAIAARRLRVTARLVELAKNKDLRGEGDFVGRLAAIRSLGDLAIGQVMVGRVLLGIFTDEGDDVRVRKEAAEAIGRSGYGSAIPQLVAMLERPRDTVPVSLREDDAIDKETYVSRHDVRFGAARALGLLRARVGVDGLSSILKDGIVDGHVEEGGLASVAGEALARIGESTSLPLLEMARDAADGSAREEWSRRIALAKGIASGDGEAILSAFREGREVVTLSGSFGPCDRYWIDLLSDVVRLDDLKVLASKYPEGATAEVVGGALEKAAR